MIRHKIFLFGLFILCVGQSEAMLQDCCGILNAEEKKGVENNVISFLKHNEDIFNDKFKDNGEAWEQFQNLIIIGAKLLSSIENCELLSKPAVANILIKLEEGSLFPCTMSWTCYIFDEEMRSYCDRVDHESIKTIS